jgi:RNA polymerase sigma-70 factor (ECF subfamily)
MRNTELPRIDGGQHSAPKHRGLLRAFAALPDEQQAVLLLVGVEDLSYEEAARVLGIPIGTVMSRLSRGRDALRRAMHEEAIWPISSRFAPLSNTLA